MRVVDPYARVVLVRPDTRSPPRADARALMSRACENLAHLAPGTGRPWKTVATGVAREPAGGTKKELRMEFDTLLQSQVEVVNIGLREFARDLAACRVPVVHVDWSPPAVTDPKIADLLAKLGG